MTTIQSVDFSPGPIYTYKRYDPCNNIIQCDENPSLPVFTTTSTRGLMDNLKHTVIECETSADKSVKIRGEIDWKNKRIAVEGVSKTFSEVKRKLGGVFSQDTEWTWSSRKYTTTHRSRVWTMRRDGREVAVYKSLIVKTFSKNEAATLKFLVEIPDEEKVFLILALMFHDFKLPPRKSLGEVAVQEGVNLGVGIACNVAFSSCVIQ